MTSGMPQAPRAGADSTEGNQGVSVFLYSRAWRGENGNFALKTCFTKASSELAKPIAGLFQDLSC